MSWFSKSVKIGVLLTLILSGCNLPKAEGIQPGGPTAAAGPTSPTSGTSGLAVQISTPAEGAALPSGNPVTVGFSATGGPFLEADLFVDGSVVATLPVSAPDTRLDGTLQWSSPTDGPHTLEVTVLDLNKNQASAQVHVTVGQGQAAAATVPAAPPEPASNSSLQLRFVGITDGDSLAATMVDPGGGKSPVPDVHLQVEVTGGVAADIRLEANGQIALDPTAHTSLSINLNGANPFTGMLDWSPVDGGGQYTLVASAIDSNKNMVKATIHVTVTGVAAFTPTPPPPSEVQARQRFAQLYQQLYHINIPDPAMQRFDFPRLPSRSRWISSIYYKGMRYYIELYDDTHYEATPPEQYADPTQPSSQVYLVLCKPAGLYKVLVVYVDYGNLTVDKADALTQVPIIANWTNSLYDKFATDHGFKSSPLHIQAEAAWISTPPVPGRPITSAQIRSATGFDPAKYNFVFEIDIDRDNQTGKGNWKGVLENGGGLALQGCGMHDPSEGDINVFSIVKAEADTQSELHGVLSMDFNHEMSHLFGMLDSWPFSPGSITSPDGLVHDDWITYVMFGWSDTDGDGLPEILDPTPYGSTGPQP